MTVWIICSRPPGWLVPGSNSTSKRPVSGLAMTCVTPTALWRAVANAAARRGAPFSPSTSQRIRPATSERTEMKLVRFGSDARTCFVASFGGEILDVFACARRDALDFAGQQQRLANCGGGAGRATRPTGFAAAPNSSLPRAPSTTPTTNVTAAGTSGPALLRSLSGCDRL